MTRIHPTAVVDSGAEIDTEAEIGAYSIVGPHVRVGARTRIMPHVFLDGHTTIGPDCVIFPFASIGSQTQDLKFKGGVTQVEIGARTTLREYVTVNSGTSEGDVTRVGEGCHIMAYAHVAHQCEVGNGVIIANAGTLAGHVIVEDKAVIGGLCGIHQFVRIGRMAIMGGCTKATQDIPPYMMVDGNPATAHGVNIIGLERRGVPEESRRNLKAVYRILYREKLNTRQALEKIRDSVPMTDEVRHVVEFIDSSERGIVR